MEVLTDTVAVIRHLCNFGTLGKTAIKLFEEADSMNTKIVISSISLMEIMRIAQKGNMSLTLKQVVEIIRSNQNYRVHDLETEVILEADSIKSKLELHDKMIVATAKFLKIPLITCDQAIIDSKEVEIIWN